jgi:hypothetical protein
MTFPKNPAIRNTAWRACVNKRMPCVLRGVMPAVAAHVSWNSGRGMAYKASDDRIIPLAPELHVLQGTMPEWKFWTDNIGKAPKFLAQCVKLWRAQNHDPFVISEAEHVMPALILWAQNEFRIFRETGRPAWL